jgi:CheY-like chemotaxis protein
MNHSAPDEVIRMPQKPLLLIADDDQGIRNVLKLAFEGDFRCRLAKDGRQAVEFARIENPDLILMDILMPRLTGWEAIREIRSIGLNTPIIVMTGFSHTWREADARELGVTEYLVKPFCLHHLKDLIARKIHL